MIFTLVLATFILNFPMLGHAIEPQSPATFCERFLGDNDKSACEKRVLNLAPDWYLAKVCEKQFDDENFWSCLELSQRFNFNPKTIAFCGDDGLTDTQRLLCVEEKALRKNASITEAYQRLPASSAKPKTKTKKLH